MRICLDSRLIEKGDYFVPVKGFAFDGHTFIDSAIEKGAAGIIEEEKLYELASQKLSSINPKVIAITGSLGKSTMRDFISTFLSSKYSICIGTLNTKLGLAVNIINDLKPSDEFFVAETGMDHKGELKETGNFIKPDYVVLTSIRESHMGKLGTLEDIKHAKAEIFKTIKPKGKVFLNWDDKNIRDVESLIPEGIKKIKYSLKLVPKYFKSLKFNFIGSHNYLHALGAIMLSKEFGFSEKEIINLSSQLKTPKGRLNIIEGINGSTIIDDSYNASSPDSIISGIKAAIDYYSKNKLRGNKILILGAMLELGNFEDDAHKIVGEFIKSSKIDKIVLVGETAKKYQIPKTNLTDDPIKASELIKSELKKGDIIYVKASQGIRLDKTVLKLMLHPEDARDLLPRQDARWK